MKQEFHPIIFFDGVCNVCNETVDFILKRDPETFMFAPLQGNTAKEKLSPELTSENLRSIVLLDENGTHIKSQAILRILRHLEWPWKGLWFFIIIPNKIRDFFYDYFANHRYQWFGKKDTCRLPTFEEKKRFLD